jgi:dienelactone hydrolase
MVMVFVPPSSRRDRRPGQKPPAVALVAIGLALAGAIGAAIASKGTASGRTSGAPVEVLVVIAVVAVLGAVVKRIKLMGESAETGDEPAHASGDESDPDIDAQGPIALLVVSSFLAILALVILLLALPRIARAQGAAPTSVTWIFTRGTDTISVERVTRGRSSIAGDIAMRGLPRIAYVAELDAGPSVPVMTFQVYGAGAGPDAAPLQSGALRVGPDSTSIEATAGGNTQRASRPIAGRPIPLINGSVALLELLIARARAAGTGPYTGRFVLLQGTGVPLDVRVDFIGRDSAVMAIAGVVHRFAFDAAGEVTGASIPQQGVVISRAVGAAGLAVSLGRPSYGAPAGAPYTAEEVVVRTSAGHSLTGTLTVPNDAKGPVPAIVTITGSGQEDRDEYIPLVPNYRPFRQIADTLGRRGIAVLRLDDRGINGSGGPVAMATSADFADDIRAGVAFLRARPEIDGARIGLAGHSEGGAIAPMVAATDAKIAAVVLLAGPAYNGRRIIDFQLKNLVMGDSTIPAAAKDSAVKAQVAAFEASSGKAPWMKFFLTYDPLPTLRKVKAPVLIVQGGTDQQVTPEQAPILDKTLREAGNRDVTLRVFPERNHLLLADPVGFPGAYTKLKDGHIGGDVMGPIADWIVATLAAPMSRP